MERRATDACRWPDSFNIDNQIDTSGLGFSFDGNGNPTSDFSNTFTFDSVNRPTGFSTSSFSATYSGFDERATEADSTRGTVYFLNDLDGQPLVEEQMVSGSAKIIWVHGRGPDGEREGYDVVGSQYHAYCYDPEGNLEARSNGNSSSQEVQDVDLYDGYGELLLDQTPSNTFPSTPQDSIGFAGQWGGYSDFDVSFGSNTGIGGKTLGHSTGIVPVAMTHRYFDSRTGRFLNRDPVGYNGGINIYGYAGSNPITGADPSGFSGGGMFGTDSDFDPWTYFNNLFSHATPATWAYAAVHNDTTKAVVMTADLVSYVPLPENPVFDEQVGATVLENSADVASLLKQVADEVMQAGGKRASQQTISAGITADGRIVVSSQSSRNLVKGGFRRAYLSAKQQAVVSKYGAIYARGANYGHAEVNVMGYSKSIKKSIVGIYATNRICINCQKAVEANAVKAYTAYRGY